MRLRRLLAAVFGPPRYPPAYEPVHGCRVLSASATYWSDDVMRRAAQGDSHA